MGDGMILIHSYEYQTCKSHHEKHNQHFHRHGTAPVRRIGDNDANTKWSQATVHQQHWQQIWNFWKFERELAAILYLFGKMARGSDDDDDLYMEDNEAKPFLDKKVEGLNDLDIGDDDE